ncbi:MAG: T9SS type A sorting domain-containing protein [Ignavibacteriota bacterium]
MKVFRPFLFLVLISVSLFYGFRNDDDKDPANKPISKSEYRTKFLENLHYPYGVMLPREVLDRIIKSIESMPDEGVKALNSWVSRGPFGINRPENPGSYYSGRVLDIEGENGVSTRVGTAGGGLWGYNFLLPVSLSDNLYSLAISSFDSKPDNASIIIIATGENNGLTGTGIWRTTNTGSSWTKITLTSDPVCFYKLRFDPVNYNIVHAAGDNGYYKSTDAGLTFTKYLSGRTTDIAVNPSNNQIMYTSIWGDGIYKSINGGLIWVKLTTGGIPSVNVGRVAIALAQSSPNTLYFNITNNSDNSTNGIYKTINGGTSYTNISSLNIHSNQGWYTNMIGVSPTNPNLVIAGGLILIRTSDGGTTWNNYFNSTDPLYDPYNIHSDLQCITWHSNGVYVWIGHDGGLSFSQNSGLNWSSTTNRLPITQYSAIDIGGNGTHIIGGAFDNGAHGTTDGGNTWWLWHYGDGGGVSIDPNNTSKFLVSTGVGSTYAFSRRLTTDNGITWTASDNGVDPNGHWYYKIKNDKLNPISYYFNSGNYVYELISGSSTWTKLNPAAFPAVVENIGVSRYTVPKAVIYACLGSSTAGQRLRVYDAGTWYERSTGFPAGIKVQAVATHQTNSNLAYALMNGLGSAQKIFKTTNRGVSWRDITGNLLNVPVTNLITHPTDTSRLYVGTEFGCYKTSNGGISWVRWNNGMSPGIFISDMNYIDSISANGKFYVVTATFGRGIWMRDISGDDPLIGIHNNTGDVKSFELMQNYPNPFNPTTEIKFALPVSDIVTIKVFDVTGKEVATLINRKMEQGVHTVKFDGSELSSGMYFYRLTSGKFTDVKKMALIK